MAGPTKEQMMRPKKAPTMDKRGRCGTSAGYQAHLRRGEHACLACREAHKITCKQRREGIPISNLHSSPKGKYKKDRPLDENAKKTLKRMEIDDPSRKPSIGNAHILDETDQTNSNEPREEVKVEPSHYADLPEGIPTPPNWLKAVGLKLWIEVCSEHELSPAALTMLGEACRTADRLERFSAALNSRTTFWFEVAEIERATDLGIPIVVNGMIGEARQLQNTLRSTLSSLGVLKAKSNGKAGKSPLDQLAARRKARLAANGMEES